MKKIFSLALVLALCVGVLPFGVIAADDTISAQIKVQYQQDMARDVLEYVNEFRTGDEAWYWNDDDMTAKTDLTGQLGELSYDYDLESVAMQRAAEIALNFDHIRPDGTYYWTAYDEAEYVYYACAENIAAGGKNAYDIFTDWLEEDVGYSGQGHRRNMLDEDVTNIGIACVVYNGTYYWVMELATPGSNSGNTTDETFARIGNETVDVLLANSMITSLSLRSPNEGEMGESDRENLPTEVSASLLMTSSAYGSCTIIFPDVSWSVEDESIVQIEGDELVAISAGTTTVTGYTVAGSTSFSVTVSHYTTFVDRTSATCTEDGSSTYICTICGETIVEVIPATGHRSVHAELVTATCTEDGYYRETCTVCGTILENEIYPAIGHNWVVGKIVDSTCVSDGYTTYTCAYCGESYNDDYTSATGHSWDSGVTTKEATENESGEITYTCITCGETKTESISAVGYEEPDEVLSEDPDIDINTDEADDYASQDTDEKNDDGAEDTDDNYHISGDINNDGVVNISDVQTLLKYVNGQEVAVVLDACDCDCNGTVNIGDVQLLLKYVNGQEVTIY